SRRTSCSSLPGQCSALVSHSITCAIWIRFGPFTEGASHSVRAHPTTNVFSKVPAARSRFAASFSSFPESSAAAAGVSRNPPARRISFQSGRARTDRGVCLGSKQVRLLPRSSFANRGRARNQCRFDGERCLQFAKRRCRSSPAASLVFRAQTDSFARENHIGGCGRNFCRGLG